MPVARLRGVVEEKGADWVIVGVGGIGLVASVPATTADALVTGQPAAFYTYLNVREDALTLFGFTTRDDLVLFEQLISVSGVGPRVALGLLSTLDYAQLTLAIAGGRSDVLRKVPGIGQKTAERLVLELRDKLLVSPSSAGSVAAARPVAPRFAEGPLGTVAVTLVQMGFKPGEADRAVALLVDRAEGKSVESLLREALASLA